MRKLRDVSSSALAREKSASAHITDSIAPSSSLAARSYAERCPERLSPGRFDFLGGSHQIFHVLILLAALSHWTAIAEAHRFWHGEMQGSCPAWALPQN